MNRLFTALFLISTGRSVLCEEYLKGIDTIRELTAKENANVTKNFKKTKKRKKSRLKSKSIGNSTSQISNNYISRSFDTSIVLHSTQGFNASMINNDIAAQRILGQAIEQGLSPLKTKHTKTKKVGKRTLLTSMISISFNHAQEAIYGSMFSTVDFSTNITTSKSETEIQHKIDSLASSGVLTNILNQLDPSNLFGFSMSSSMVTAVYENVLSFHNVCDKRSLMDGGLDKALRGYHHRLNHRYNQTFLDINVVDVKVEEESDCIESRRATLVHGRDLKGTKWSQIRYFLLVRCNNNNRTCPNQSIPTINNGQRRELVETHDDDIPLEDELIKLTGKETGVKVESIQTDENENKIVGCIDLVSIDGLRMLQEFSVEPVKFLDGESFKTYSTVIENNFQVPIFTCAEP